MLPLAASVTVLQRKMVETESVDFQEKASIWKTAIFPVVVGIWSIIGPILGGKL